MIDCPNFKALMVGFGEAASVRDITHPFILRDNAVWPNQLRLTIEEAKVLRQWIGEQLARPDCRRPL